MGLNASIELAFSGLRATQAGLDVVSQNVANAGATGYTRRTLNVEQQVAGGRTIGVDIAGASRTLDGILQRQLRLEQAGAGYTSVKAAGYTALDALFDAPGASSGLPTLLNSFTTALQTLANNPTLYTNRAAVLSAASDLAGSLNGLSGQVQAMRQSAEDALGAAVSKADGLLQRIQDLNAKVVADPRSAALHDQRDALIDQLSSLMDVKVTPSASGGITITTSGGLQLFDGVNATRLSFDARQVGPGAAYDADPDRRGVGTVTATDAAGVKRDVIASGLIRSGEIAAQIELRDSVLPRAQRQLDELAAGLASALSDKRVDSTAASSGAQAGFDLDLAGLSAGNRVSVTVNDAGGGSRTLTFVKTTSAAGADAATASGAIGIDFSGGMASVVTQIGTALGAAYTVSNPSGSTLRVLGDGASNTVASLSANVTAIGLQTGGSELPLFVDGGRANAAYTGSYEGGAEIAGFASRIVVNPGALADPSLLVKFSASTAAGDTTRPSFLLDRLTGAAMTFSGAAGIGGSNAPFTGTVGAFAQQVVATQAADANAATTLDDGQKVVLNSVQSRFAEQAGVNIDTEMTQLIQLQTAYGANARLLTAAKDMMDLLLRIGA